MDLQTAIQKIYSLHQFTIKLGLERITALLDKIGNPHKGLKYIHIAGSNGKGSTASFMASILMEAGFNVGLYTSPHFVRFNERIRINGKEISDEYISNFISSVDNLITELEPTFFEITTALAFKYFSERKPDIIILETGLGGRLDATNVIEPLASVITSISLEHTNILGDTIEKIASEKAGIIKPNSILISGLIQDSVRKIFDKKSSDLKISHFNLEITSKVFKDSILLHLANEKLNIYRTGLTGFHQVLNGALAALTVFKTFGIDDINIINKGLLNVVQNVHIEGRFEVINEKPTIILDSAHNPEAVKSFITEFSKVAHRFEERILIFGVMKDKNYEEMIEHLLPHFNKVYAAQAKYERALAVNDILDFGLKRGITFQPVENPSDFIREYKKERSDSCLVVLGSMYLIGEIKSRLAK
jgi:dihydrofolate synthase/folylpolyglutamate synthase